jgi:glycosyltransferase 2 family protein
MVGILLTSLLIWLAEGAAQWCILYACGVSLDMLGMCLVIGVVSLSTLLPSPPGFLGTMQFAFVLSVTILGYSSPQGLAAALANQIFLLGSMVAVGLALLLVTYSRRFTAKVRANRR